MDEDIVNIEDLLKDVDLDELGVDLADGDDDGEEGEGEEFEDTVDDVTEMYELDDDGTLFYKDSKTGEKVVVGSISEEGDDDDVDLDDDEEDNDEDMFAGLSDSERLEKISEILLAEEVSNG